MSSISSTKLFDSKINESLIRYFIKNIQDLRVYRYAITNFVRNNLRMRYRRSTLGFLWTMLNPLLVMSVVSVVFALIYQRDIHTFAIYIFSGLSPWGFINQSIQGGSQSLVHAEGYLKKVYLPKVMFPIISVSTELINFFFSILSLYILALILGSPLTWRLLLLPFAALVTYLFVLGLVMLFSVATVYFRDLTQILSVVFTALFYTIPIVYPIEMIPEQYRIYFQLNPFYYYVQLFRKVFYAYQQPFTVSEWVIPILLAVVSCAVGLYVLMKKDRDIVYRL